MRDLVRQDPPLTDGSAPAPLSPAQKRGFWAAWAGWALDGMDSFIYALVLAPAITAYRRPLERVAVVLLSLYVLAALIGIGVVLGGLIVLEWPRVF